MKKIDIVGNSGCNVKIVGDENNVYLFKSTNDVNYIDRLILQSNKQINEFNRLKNLNNKYNIYVPTIYNVNKTKNAANIIMEYIESENFIEYFMHSSNEEIFIFINNILSYINDNIKNSEIKTYNKKIFINKIKSIEEKCKEKNIYDQQLFDYAYKYLESLEKDINILVGNCHGDLTLSNIRFVNKKIYLIDFLDCFIESPIQDIIKLRQDTKYFWSTYFYNKKYNVLKLINCLNYIDNIIVNYDFDKKDIIIKNYELFEIMNLYRLLPYIKNDEIKQLVYTTIKNKFKNGK